MSAKAIIRGTNDVQSLLQQIEENTGGGGGAVTVADGADVALGAKADAAQTDPAATASLIAFTKGVLDRLANIIGAIGNISPAIGSMLDAAVTDPTATASEISLLKGLLKALLSPVTNNFVTITTGSQVVPIGAKGWSATFLTGTGTINSQAVPAGTSIGDTNVTANTVTIAVDADSSAFVRWNTFP